MRGWLRTARKKKKEEEKLEEEEEEVRRKNGADKGKQAVEIRRK